MPVESEMMEPQELPVHPPAVGSNSVKHGRGWGYLEMMSFCLQTLRKGFKMPSP